MEMASARDESRRQSLRRDWGKARKILQEDSEQFRKHNAERDQFLQHAIEMFARSLEVADIYDDDAPIRFCSLWFANFDGGEDIQGTIGAALGRIPSYKMVFLAVSCLSFSIVSPSLLGLASTYCQAFVTYGRTAQEPRTSTGNGASNVQGTPFS
jgi:hypothetical protein